MRDRFPLLVLGALLLAGVLGTFLVRGAQRGGFADPLSTFRAEPDGARALYLLAQESGLPVTRNMTDLSLLTGHEALVLLAVEVQDSREEDPDQTRLASDPDAGVDDESAPHQGFNALRAQQLDDKEVERVLSHVRAGASLVYVPWGSRENALLDELGVKLDKADVTLPMRTLVPSLPTPYTLGVERVEAKVQAYLRLPEGAVTVLEDERLGFPVAAVIPAGLGRVLVVGAPELAMNPALARADNAQFWLSALEALGPGPFAFDEFHHRALARGLRAPLWPALRRRAAAPGRRAVGGRAEALRPAAPSAGVHARGRHGRPLRHEPPVPRGPAPRLRRGAHHARPHAAAGAARGPAFARHRHRRDLAIIATAVPATDRPLPEGPRISRGPSVFCRHTVPH